MSLDFSYKDCGKTKEEQDVLSTHPADPERWHPVGDSLVWMSMFCGFSRITADTVDKVWERINLYQRVSGGSVYRFMVEGQPRPLMLNRSDVERYVGLSTNASAKTDAQFFVFLKRIALDEGGKEESAFDWITARFAADKVIAKAADKGQHHGGLNGEV